MKEVKKPSMLVAVLATISCISMLLSILLMIVNKNHSGALLIFMTFTVGLLFFTAISNWVLYFKNMVRYEVENNSKQD